MLKSRASERSAPDESVEAVRRRARYRLVGALVLVVLGVVGFPLIFDTQPRPLDTDLAIVIPDKTQVAPLTVSQPTAAPQGQREETLQPVTASSSDASPTAQPMSQPVKADGAAQGQSVEPAQETALQAGPKPLAESAPKAERKPEPKPEPKPQPVPRSATEKDEAARARAILEGRSSAVKADGQWVVQVGAYSDEASVQRVRRMLEAKGLKTFTQAVAVSGGTVTRVRLGPYANTADAERAQAQAKRLGFAGAKVLKP